VALVPVRVGNLSALVEKSEPSRCSVPACHGDHWTSCEYPVGPQLATARTCDARICAGHIFQWGKLDICPAHGRLVARMKLTVQREEIR
jgi:hypothetical protein